MAQANVVELKNFKKEAGLLVRMRNYKKVRECPQIVLELIDKANSLPPDFEIRGFWGSFEASREKERENFEKRVKLLPDEFIKTHGWINKVLNGETITLDSSLANRKEEVFSKILNTFDIELKNEGWLEFEINETSDQVTNWYDPHTRLRWDLENAKNYRQSFLRLIKWNKSSEEVKKSIKLDDGIATVTIKKGVITYNKPNDKVLTVVISEKVNSERFGECEICKKIFWSKKIGSSTCGGKSCTDTIGNQRRSTSKKSTKKQMTISQDRINHREWFKSLDFSNGKVGRVDL